MHVFFINFSKGHTICDFLFLCLPEGQSPSKRASKGKNQPLEEVVKTPLKWGRVGGAKLKMAELFHSWSVTVHPKVNPIALRMEF